MNSHLLRFKPEQKYLVWDLETCNLNLAVSVNLPWQLGFLTIENNEVKETKTLYIYWKNLKVSAGAAKVTRFNHQTYLDMALPAQDVLGEFETYLYDPNYLVIGHNQLNFDIYVHKIWREQLGYRSNFSYLNRCIDTNAVAKGIKLDRKYRPPEDFLVYQYRMLSVRQKGLKSSLTALGKENNIPFDYENLHDAGNDILLNWIIWNKVLRFQVEV